jgi:hypothetical protein
MGIKAIFLRILFQAALIFFALVFLFLLYVVSPRRIDLVIVNRSGSDVTDVSVLACKKLFEFPLIKQEGSVTTRFSPSCEGAYDVSYRNVKGEVVSSKNMGYITTHIYAMDTIRLFSDKADYATGRRIF